MVNMGPESLLTVTMTSRKVSQFKGIGTGFRPAKFTSSACGVRESDQGHQQRGTTSNESDNPQVTIKPEEDARLPILKAQIEREWRQFRKAYVKELLKNGRLKSQVHATAIWCVQVLHQYEERGLGADQGREAIQALIHPQFDRS